MEQAEANLRNKWGLEYSSAVECLPGMCETLGWVPSTAGTKWEFPLVCHWVCDDVTGMPL